MEDSGDRALYAFEPVSEDEDDAKIFENLDARLAIAKDGPYVASVEMRSRGPFPAAPLSRKRPPSGWRAGR